MDHRGPGVAHDPVAVGGDGKAHAPGEVRDFPGPGQEIRVGGPAEPFIADPKGLIDQQAARRRQPQGPPEGRAVEVVGHQDAFEAFPGEGPGTAVLEIEAEDFQALAANQVRKTTDVPVDRENPMALAEQHPDMPPAAAGEVQYAEVPAGFVGRCQLLGGF